MNHILRGNAKGESELTNLISIKVSIIPEDYYEGYFRKSLGMSKEAEIWK